MKSINKLALFLFILLACFKTLGKDDIEEYWTKHTVKSSEFKTPEESIWYLDYRMRLYPFAQELLYGDIDKSFSNQVILDYGCGPGNDLVNFLIYSGAKKIYGVDVSEKSLELSQKRLNLHKGQGYNISKIELIKAVNTKDYRLPIEDNSVDFINCVGVLMHCSYPEHILQEFFRVLKSGGRARVMVYNKYSIWKHLYVGYQKMVLGQPINHAAVAEDHYSAENKKYYEGLDLERVFTMSTDGPNCPVSANYSPQEFIALANKAGFQAEFSGAYFSILELGIFRKFRDDIIGNKLPRFNEINEVSKDFIKHITISNDGYPKYNNHNAGIGAVFELYKK